MSSLAAKEWDALIITPPCNTWSRLPWSDSPGPKPLRSRRHPWGFPWLSGKALIKCNLGNSFVKQTLEAANAAFDAGTQFLVEHPEDLGVTSSGGEPASIWMLEDLLATHSRTSAHTAALFQCTFGAPYGKPTRLWGTLPGLTTLPHQGWPMFSKQGNYQGPLPKTCGHQHSRKLVGRNSDGGFNSEGSAAYPPLMCKWIAECIATHTSQARRSTSTTIGTAAGKQGGGQDSAVPEAAEEEREEEEEGKEEEAPSSEDDGAGHPKALLQNHLGGVGPPMQVVWAGRRRDFHDGAGLCSPGRWHPDKRRPCSSPLAAELRQGLQALLRAKVPNHPRLVFQLACGQLSSSPFSPDLLTEARGLWFALLERRGLQPAQLRVVPDFQPFLLPALGATMQILGDPDWRILDERHDGFSSGVPVGVHTKMPRVPALYERKVRWRKLDVTDFSAEVENYRSIVGLEDQLERQFEEEAALGMMFRIPEEEARREWPNLRIAAQGALLKGDSSFRVIHDATHGVHLNVDLQVRDQVRMPTAGDVRAAMQESSELPGPHFSLQLDVKKAHRRFRHRRADWGLLGCRLRPGELWLNRVGTFGVGSAGYWWSRLASSVARLVMAVNGLPWFFQLIYADDLRLTAHGEGMYTALLLAVLLWEMVGAPFSWGKTSGGMSTEWVGYWLDYAKFELGVTEKRARWLKEWLDTVVDGRPVLVRALTEGLGRLAFATGVLEWGRPFLGPLFSWVSAVPGGSYLPLPPMVRATLTWVRDQLAGGRHTSSGRKPAEFGLLFKADAKAEESRVVLGGYSCQHGPDLNLATWFSLELTELEAPWLFCKGHGSRTVATSELLASLLCVVLLAPPLTTNGRGLIRVTGVTDNQGNSYIVAKLLTTKFPLAPVLMELVKQLASRGLWLHLQWAPREENTAADDLTNGRFELFDQARRVATAWPKILASLTDLQKYLDLGEAFYQEVADLKEKRKQFPLPPPSSHKKAKKLLGPW
jgi:hypothetical protein